MLVPIVQEASYPLDQGWCKLWQQGWCFVGWPPLPLPVLVQTSQWSRCENPALPALDYKQNTLSLVQYLVSACLTIQYTVYLIKIGMETCKISIHYHKLAVPYLRVRWASSLVTMVIRKVRVEREASTVRVFWRRHASTNSTWYSRGVKMVECTFSGCTRFICKK